MRSLMLMSAVLVAASGLSGCCIHHGCGTGDCGTGCAVGCGVGCGDCGTGCGPGGGICAGHGFFDRLLMTSGRATQGCGDACGESCGDACGGGCGTCRPVLGGRLAGRIQPTILRWLVVTIGLIVAIIYILR